MSSALAPWQPCDAAFIASGIGAGAAIAPVRRTRRPPYIDMLTVHWLQHSGWSHAAIAGAVGIAYCTVSNAIRGNRA